MPTPNPSNSCKVTNNLVLPLTTATPAQTNWDGTVVVLNGYVPSGGSPAMGYEQNLTLLSFADGSTSLAVGQSKTLMLDLSVPGTSTQMSSYDLLVSQSNNLFPVALVVEINLLGSFPAVALPVAAPADSSSAANAFNFVQTIQAFPGCDLAQSFSKASNKATSPKATQPIDAAINQFFASTTAFQNVTFYAYLAAQSYISAFAFAWANFQNNYTYYVYTNGQAASSTDPTSSSSGSAVSELGTIVFNQTGSGVPPVTDPSGGYSITYTPAGGGQSVNLTFVKGQLVLTSQAGVQEICLQCNFMSKSDATGNSDDYNTIIPALLGTVYGQQAIATACQQPSPSEAGSSGSGVQGILNSPAWSMTMDLMNLGMGLQAWGELLGSLFKAIKSLIGGGKASGGGSQDPKESSTSEGSVGEDSSTPDTDELRAQIFDAVNERVRNTGLSTDELTPEGLSTAQENYAKLVTDEQQIQGFANDIEAAAAQGANVEDEVSEFNQVEEEIQNPDLGDTKAADNITESIDSLQETISSEMGTAASETNAQTAQSLDNSSTAESEAQQQQEEENKSEEESSDNDNSETGDDTDDGEDDDIDFGE